MIFEVHIGFDLEKRFVNKLDHVCHILFCDHFYRRVHIAKWKRNQRGRNATVGVGKCICISSGCSARGRTLKRNILVFRGLYDEIA